MNNVLQITAVFNYHFQFKIEDFEACTEKEREMYPEYDVPS